MKEESYYNVRIFQEAVDYWDKKDVDNVKLNKTQLKAMAETYIMDHNTCALAIGAGEYIRCTPIEYSYHDGCFWMFSEGGKKFIGLSQNSNVCLAIYDKYEGFGKLRGMQIMRRAELVAPFSNPYLAHAAYKKISLDFLKKLESPMHLICVHPIRMECLFSDFKEWGCAPRQTLELEKTVNEEMNMSK